MRKILLAAALAVPATLVVASPAAADTDIYCAGFTRNPSGPTVTVHEPEVYTDPILVIIPVPEIDPSVDDGDPYVKSADTREECHSEGEVVFML